MTGAALTTEAVHTAEAVRLALAAHHQEVTAAALHHQEATAEAVHQEAIEDN